MKVRASTMPATARPQQAWITALLLLLCWLGGCSERGVSVQALAPDAVILAFGDSLTHGTGARKDQSYPVVLAELTGRTVVTDAVPGETTAAAESRLVPALEKHEPALVILCLGGNDMLRKQDRTLMYTRLEQMVKQARGYGAQVLLLGVPEPKLLGLKAEPGYAELAKRLKLPLENTIIAEVLSDRDLKSDPIHPNAEGYRQIAEAIAARLRKDGAI